MSHCDPNRHASPHYDSYYLVGSQEERAMHVGRKRAVVIALPKACDSNIKISETLRAITHEPIVVVRQDCAIRSDLDVALMEERVWTADPSNLCAKHLCNSAVVLGHDTLANGGRGPDASERGGRDMEVYRAICTLDEAAIHGSCTENVLVLGHAVVLQAKDGIIKEAALPDYNHRNVRRS